MLISVEITQHIQGRPPTFVRNTEPTSSTEPLVRSRMSTWQRSLQVCVLAWSALPCVAQNLVPNPGLENTTPFCGVFSTINFNNLVDNWSTPTLGSPDICHTSLAVSCPNTAIGSTASNAWGSEQPAGGEAMAALITYCQGCATETREYMQAELLQPLVPGQLYRASMQVSLGDRSRFASDGIGFHFSTTAIGSPSWVSLPITPQVETTSVITTTDGWVEVAGEFVADAPHAYITIGNFRNDANTSIINTGAMPMQYAAYFVDEIAVVPVTDEPSIIGSDTICLGDSTILTAVNGGVDVLWYSDDGSGGVLGNDTLLWVSPQVATTYFIVVGEDTAYHTVDVVVRPQVDLGNDTTICAGQLLLFDATVANASYQWNDGSTGPMLGVSGPGTIHVSVTVNGCTVSDTVNVLVQPLPMVQLGNDTLLCPDEVLVLSAGAPDASYSWQDGSMGPEYSVEGAGTYWVAGTVGTCTASDTIHVQYEQVSGSQNLHDGQYCIGDPLVVDLSGNPGGFVWWDGYEEPIRILEHSGTYDVQIVGGQCLHFFQFSLEFISCDPALEMPNVFSPNGDGTNDLFLPIVARGILRAQLSVYDRWGLLLYTTSDLMRGWSGRGASEGVYFFIVEYTDIQGNDSSVSGHVMLLR